MNKISFTAVAVILSGLAAMPVFADDDRFENLNRKVFYVNDRLDKYASY